MKYRTLGLQTGGFSSLCRTGTAVMALGLGAVCTLVGSPAAEAQVYETAKKTPSDGASFDLFGDAIDVSGNYAVAGAPRDDDGGSSSGAAYVFELIDDVWLQIAKLTSSNAADTDLMGTSVAIDGDIIVVGAPFSDVNAQGAGAVFVFEKPGGGWANMTETAVLSATDIAPGDQFGQSVAIENGTIAVGATQQLSSGKGKAYVFVEPGTGWESMSQTAILTSRKMKANDLIGFSISIGDDVVAVGAPGNDLAATDAGMVLVYVKPLDGWIDANDDAKLYAGNAAKEDGLGTSVANSGALVVSGAPFYDGGASNSGAVYLFRPGHSGWKNAAHEAILTSGNPDPIDEMGNSVALADGIILAGAHKADGATTNGGAVFTFEKPKQGWISNSESNIILASDSAGADGFGTSVALDGYFSIIGSPFDDDRGTDSGSMYSIDLTPPCLDLEVFNLFAGETAIFVIRNGVPGRKYVVVYGLGGPPQKLVDYQNYCATFGFSYLKLQNVLGFSQFDGQGNGSIEVLIDPRHIGFTWKIQAAERNTCPDECMSNLVKREIE